MNELLLRRRVAASNRLPYDAEVRWLQCTGMQYIDTGIQAKQTLKIVCKWDNVECDNSYYVYGARDGSNSTISLSCTYINEDGYARWGSSAYTTHAGTGVCVSEQDSSGYVVNGSSKYSYDSAQQVSAASGYTIKVFGCQTSSGMNHFVNGKIYYFKVYDDGTLILDLIPVIKNGVGYMYDKVSGQLFANQGTGNFGIGNSTKYDYEVSYLQSDGNQYIDSGIECTGDLSVECVFKISELANKNLAGGIKVIDSQNYRHHVILSKARNQNTGPLNVYWYQYDTVNAPSIKISSNVTYSNYINRWIHFSLNATTGAWTVQSYSGSVTPLSASLTTGENYGIFGRIGLGTVAMQSCGFRCFKLRRNGVVLRDFIPVVKSDVGYLYDKVTDTLYGNDGTGSFTYN